MNFEKSKLNETLKQNNSDIQNILDNSNINPNERTVLKELFNNLSNYNFNRLNDIQNNILEQFKKVEYSTPNLNEENFFEIYTLLVHKDFLNSLEPLGFNEIYHFENTIGAFFECSYSDFIEVCNQRYFANLHIGKSVERVEFSLIWVDNPFKRLEETLLKLTKQYNLNRPFIFSPYSKKYAKIKFDYPIDITKVTSIDLEIPNIKVKTTLDYSLIWNVSICDKDRIVVNSYQTPCLNEVKYKLRFDSIYNNQYIVCKNPTPDLTTIRNSKNNSIDILYNGGEIYYDKVTINEVSKDTIEQYTPLGNYFNTNLLSKSRVHSNADIMYVINCFNNNPFEVTITGFEITNNNSTNKPNHSQMITNYSIPYYPKTTYRNSSKSDNLNTTLMLNTNTNCILKFSGNDNKNILEDYANYVLSYLNERYPEFHWEGERV